MATAISSYNSDGNYPAGAITTAYDSAGRRYTYTYEELGDTFDGVSRLLQVEAEINDGGWVTVGQVDYSYYNTNINDVGLAGYLRTVKVTTPMTSGSSLEKTKYYRYYTRSWDNSDGRRGHAGQIKMVLDEEGWRRYEGSDSNFGDNDYLTAAESALKSYSAVFFEYESSTSTKRIATAVFNGECGCAGGANGTHEFTYGESSGYATDITDTNYDNGWGTRTVVEQPDGTYITQYFDETGQALSRVLTAGDPSGSPTGTWVTEVIRSASNSTDVFTGCITQLRTPAANDTYTHSTGAIAALSGAGLIHTFARIEDADGSGLAGFVAERRWLIGTGDVTPQYGPQDTTYATRVYTGTTPSIVRPLVDDTVEYVEDDGSPSNTTSRTYTFHDATSTNTDYLAIESVTTTYPIVTDGTGGSANNNGPHSATSMVQWFNAYGAPTFTKAADGIISYREYSTTTGQMVKSIEDADTGLTGGGQDFNGVTIPSSAGTAASSGTEIHNKTTYTYDIYDVDVAYDLAGNVTSTVDNIRKDGSGNRIFDVAYTMDGLHRLIKAEEGTVSGGTYSANRRVLEQWGLTQTGNFATNQLSLNGDTDFTDTDEIDDTRDHYPDNSIKNWEPDGTQFDPAHDLTGNMTDDDCDYTFQYDVFGRMVSATNKISKVATEYRYNGLGHRIGWHYDVDLDGDVESTSDDPWVYHCYDERWRVVATYIAAQTTPKEQFYYHAAGLGGFGTASYIDSVILRDRDMTDGGAVAFTEEGDGTLEERVYYCQNWRADVSVLIDYTSGDPIQAESIKYFSYGTPIGIPAGDADHNGVIDSSDSTTMNTRIGGGAPYQVRFDLDLDGDEDATDVSLLSIGALGGRGVLSQDGYFNRKGYAGYENDGILGTTLIAASNSRFWHVRHRVLDSTLGRWTRRDPLGYVDGVGLYVLLLANPLSHNDPTGLLRCRGASCHRTDVVGYNGKIPVVHLSSRTRSPYELDNCLASCDYRYPVGPDRAACRQTCRSDAQTPEERLCCETLCATHGGPGVNGNCNGRIITCTCPSNPFYPDDPTPIDDYGPAWSSQFLECVAIQEDCINRMFEPSPDGGVWPSFGWDECRMLQQKRDCICGGFACIQNIRCPDNDVVCHAARDRQLNLVREHCSYWIQRAEERCPRSSN